MILFGGFTIAEVQDRGYGVWSVFANTGERCGTYDVKVRSGNSELEATGLEGHDVASVIVVLGSCFKPTPVLTLDQAAADMALQDAEVAW